MMILTLVLTGTIPMAIERLGEENETPAAKLLSNWTVGIKVLRNTSNHFGLAKKAESM